MKKPLVTLLFLSLIMINASAQEAQGLKLTIINETSSTLSDARVRVDAGNEWINIGDVRADNSEHPKEFTVPGPLNSVPGLFQFRVGTNQQWMSSVFKKSANNTEVVITIDNAHPISHAFDGYLSSPALQPSFTIEADTQKDSKEFFSAVPGDGNSWSATCKTADSVKYGAFYCTINSSPALVFCAANAHGLGLAIAWGTFDSSKTPEELIELKEDHWGFASAGFYMHLWAPDGSFNGGGFGAGGGFGVGVYVNANDSCPG